MNPEGISRVRGSRVQKSDQDNGFQMKFPVPCFFDIVFLEEIVYP
jgi:hypothetical protein